MQFRLGKNLLRSYALLMMVFLYGPVALMAIFSFNKGYTVGTKHLGSLSTWMGFSLEWYTKLFETPQVLEGFRNSLLVAAASASIATMLATLVVHGLIRQPRRVRTFVELVMLLPILIPEISYAASIMLLYSTAGIRFSVPMVAVAHTPWSMTFAYFVVKSRLGYYKLELEEAARTLGANDIQVFRRIVLPTLKPALVAAFLLCFVLSYDDFLTSAFTTGAGQTMLPLYIFSRLRYTISPELNALSAISICISFVIAFLALRQR